VIRAALFVVALGVLPFSVSFGRVSWGDELPDESIGRWIDDGREPQLADQSGNDCARCHQAIALEWSYSTHATAWQDERYQKELKGKRRPKSCWGCHIPEPLSLGDRSARPTPRAEKRHLGIDCVACHVDADGETILGPQGIATDAHPSRKSDLFSTDSESELCVQCHKTTIGPVIGIAKSFVDTAQYELGLSCVDCHMPSVKRAWANDPDTGEALPESIRKGRSHVLASPRDPVFLRRAFLLKASSDGDVTRLVIENQSGHRIPGLLERAFQFKATLLDADGKQVETGELVIDKRAYLPVEESVELVIEGTGATLELEAFHVAPGLKRPVSFWEKSFEL